MTRALQAIGMTFMVGAALFIAVMYFVSSLYIAGCVTLLILGTCLLGLGAQIIGLMLMAGSMLFLAAVLFVNNDYLGGCTILLLVGIGSFILGKELGEMNSANKT